MQSRRIPNLFLFLLLVLVSYSANATVIEAKSDGLWIDGSTWVGGSAPTATDSVLIDGFEVEVSDVVGSVKHIRLTNDSGSEGTLTLNGSTALTVDQGVYLQGEGRNQDSYIYMYGNAHLYVDGLFLIKRLASNSDDNAIGLYLYNSAKVFARAGFVFDYIGSGATEDNYEIVVSNSAVLDVTGDADFFNRNGSHLNIAILWDGDIKVSNQLNAELSNGDSLSLVSSGTSGKLTVGDTTNLINNGSAGFLEFRAALNGEMNFKTLNLVATGSNHLVHLIGNAPTLADIHVEGDINMDTYQDNTIKVSLSSFSYMYLSGNLNRLHGHGSMDMGSNAKMILNGDSPQIIPGNAGLGSDSLHFSNLVISNTSDSLILGGPLLLTENLELDTGIIFTTDMNLLILDDMVEVTGGSDVAYIEGPLKKIGSTNGMDFTFPVGKNGVYSPLVISEVTDPTFEYTAEYFKTSPVSAPLGTGLVNISAIEFWELDSSSGSDPVTVTINWYNSGMSGINDIDSLVMARHDDVTEEWVSMGTGGATEDPVKKSGSIVHDLSCPPPCCHSIITLASTSPVNPLPLNLINFAAKKTGDIVELNWITANELDIEKIEVERSFDGIRFEAFDQVYAKGGIGPFLYESKDRAPKAGVNYYRLKIVEILGAIVYSDIKTIDFERENEMKVFPNPMIDKVQIMGTQFTQQDSKIEVINQAGLVIYQGIHQLEKSENSLFADELNIHLPGIYFLFITNDGRTSVANFIKE